MLHTEKKTQREKQGETEVKRQTREGEAVRE